MLSFTLLRVSLALTQAPDTIKTVNGMVSATSDGSVVVFCGESTRGNLLFQLERSSGIIRAIGRAPLANQQMWSAMLCAKGKKVMYCLRNNARDTEDWFLLDLNTMKSRRLPLLRNASGVSTYKSGMAVTWIKKAGTDSSYWSDPETYVDRSTIKNSLWAMSLDGSLPHKVCDLIREVGEAVLSNDGKRVVYSALESKEWPEFLYAKDVDGKNNVKISSNLRASRFNLVISSKGLVVYDLYREGQVAWTSLYSQREQKMNLRPAPWDAAYPFPTEGDSKILYSAREHGLWVFDRNTRRFSVLVKEGDPVFSWQ